MQYKYPFHLPNLRYKLIAIFASVFGVFILSASPIFAHMVVTPKTAGVASTTSFSLGVPTENAGSTVAVRLMIPNGLDDVTPDVKAGWKIDVKRNGGGDDAPVTEIDWTATNGGIPSGERDQFDFSAIVPAQATTLQWKAYQTYDNGQIVSWDQPPAAPGATDNPNAGPYSTTQVINDLTNANTTMQNGASQSAQSKTAQLPDWIAIAALGLAAVALTVSFRNKAAMQQKDDL